MNKIKEILGKINFFHLILAFLIIFPVTQLLIGGKGHFNESLNNYAKIEAKGANISDKNSVGFDSPDVIDDKLDYIVNTRKDPIDANTYTVFLKQQENLDRLFVRINSGPTNHVGTINNFDIFVWDNGAWKKIETVYTNNKSYYVGYYQGIRTDKVKVTLAEPVNTNDHLLDVISYKIKSRNNILISGFNLFFKQQRSLFGYFFYSIIFFVLIFLIGEAAYSPIKKIFSLEENILFAFGTGFISLGGLGLALSLLPRQIGTPTVTLLILAAIIVYALKVLDFQKLRDTVQGHKRIFLAVFLFFIFMGTWTFIFDQVPDKVTGQYDIVYANNQKYFQVVGYTYASDLIFPYVAFKGIYYGLNNIQGPWPRSTIDVNFFGRPQLVSYAAYPILTAFGDSFFTYQTFILAALGFLMLAAFYLVKEIFDSGTAYLAIAILALNYYFFYIYQLTAIKLIASFFVFLLFYCLAKFKKTGATKYLIIGSVFGVAAFLVHNFTISYAVAGIFFLSPNPLNWFKERKNLLLGTGLIFLVFVGWIIVGRFTGGNKLLEQVATGGFTGNKLMNSQNIGSPIIQNIKARYLNIKGLFLTNPFPEYWPGRASFGFYKVTLIGALTIFFGPFIALGLWALRKNKKGAVILGLLLVPFLISLLSHSFPGLFGVHLYMVPSIPIFIAFGAAFLNKYEKIKIPVVVLVFTEWLYVTFIYYHLELTDKLVNYPKRNTLFLVTLLLFPLIYSVIILIKESDKSSLKKC